MYDSEPINKFYKEIDRLARRWSIIKGVHNLLPLLRCAAGVMTIHR